MTKVDELVEWAAKQAYELTNPFHPWHKAGKASKGWYRTLAKHILSHPDLALIDRDKNFPKLSAFDSSRTTNFEDGFLMCKGQMIVSGYSHSIIPLAEALRGE